LIEPRDTSKKQRSRGLVKGVAALALGLLALSIAAVEYFVFADISTQSRDGVISQGLSFGTMAYLAGYAGAGVILIAIGIQRLLRG
jgi:hypothetical protein